MDMKQIAVLKSTGVRAVIVDRTETHITLQFHMTRDTLTLRDFAIRYRTEDTNGKNPHCLARGHYPVHTVEGFGNKCSRCGETILPSIGVR